MTELSAEIVDQVVETCKAGADEAAEALGRGIDAQVKLSVGQPETLTKDALGEAFDGGGLVVVLTVGAAGALLVLPDSTGLVPDWSTDPDPTGQSRLATLAQELGMILLPEEFMPDAFQAARIDDLAAAMDRAGVAQDAARVPLELQQPDGEGVTASLIWPVDRPEAVVAVPVSEPEPAPESPAGPPKPTADPIPSKPAVADSPSAGPPAAAVSRRPPTANDLPPHLRSLLRIEVPVVVTLARKRQRLSQIMELGPGAIIQFEKSCEQMLDLDAGGKTIATGEAIKVGDKFGLRINAMVLPEERFVSVRSAKAAGRRGRDRDR